MANLCLYVFVGILILSATTQSTEGGSLHMKPLSRSIRSDNAIQTTTPPPTCSGNTPCGWAQYTPFTRVITHFMKNSCNCSPSMQCIRTDDDLSVSAYVYRCRDTKNNNSLT